MPALRHIAYVCTVLAGSACAPVLTNDLGPAVIEADAAVRAAIDREAELDPAMFPESSIGVLPFRVAVGDPALEPLGHGLASLLMTDLARSGRVVVVDRLRIDALLRELDLARTGVVDPATAPRAGLLLGARRLVYGSLAATQASEVRVDARIAVTETSSIRPVVTGAASLDEILDAEKALAFEVFDALGINLTPAERTAIEQRPTRNLEALLAFSRGVQAEAELRFFDARRHYGRAIDLDPTFVPPRDRITEIEPYLSDPFELTLVSIDAINRAGLQTVSDVTDPAFRNRQTATLVIPIIIR